LSLVELESQEQGELLRQVQEDQPQIPLSRAGGDDKLHAASAATGMDDDSEDLPRDVPPPEFQSQPSPLDCDLGEIEGF